MIFRLVLRRRRQGGDARVIFWRPPALQLLKFSLYRNHIAAKFVS